MPLLFKGAWGALAGLELDGYEIRHGVSDTREDLPCVNVTVDGKENIIGLASNDLLVLGSYLHNIFHNDLFRRGWVNTLRVSRGLPPLDPRESGDTKKRREESYDRLASILAESLDMEKLYSITGIGPWTEDHS